MALAFVGVASNALVIMVNGGYMPVWLPAYQAAGLGGPLGTVLHVPLPPTLGAEFLLRLGPLADLIPLPIPPLNNVASIGDLFLTAGLSFFLFSTVLRCPGVARGDRPGQGGAIDGRGGGDAVRWRANRRPRRPGRRRARRSDRRRHRRRAHVVAVPTGRDRLGGRAAGGHRPLPRPRGGIGPQRPLMLGGRGVGMASPATSASSQAMALDAVGVGPIDVGVPVARPSRLEDIRRHPYIRLALNGSFSALWVGQVISLFGDRVNQLALIAFVFEITDSPTAVALTFLVSTIPNLIFSPVAGTLVDRWDQKQVLVVSDLLRAALVLLVPVAVLINVWLAYPLVFLITTVSIFFRPARVAILPRIVDEGDLLSANSAMWVGETIADVINYPIAGLFVVFLASSLPLAFWFDAVTYLGSAVLLATIVVPPIVKRARRTGRRGDRGCRWTTVARRRARGHRAGRRRGLDRARPPRRLAVPAPRDGAAGEHAPGHGRPVRRRRVHGDEHRPAKQITTAPGDEYRATYAFMETAVGLGNLIGGFALGLIATRVRKGRLIIAAYVAFGALVFLVGNVSSVLVVLGLLFGVGVANMAFIIPSQTLFQERTPPELMGRVVSFRFAIVFGGMSIAMAVGGLLTTAFGPGPVIAAAGLISMAAGFGGLLVKQLREA